MRYRDRDHVDYFEDTWAGQHVDDPPAAELERMAARCKRDPDPTITVAVNAYLHRPRLLPWWYTNHDPGDEDVQR